MGMKKRIIYISYDGMTDPLGQSQVLPYLKGISLAGYSITLISLEKEIPFGQSGKEISELCETHSIHWIPKIYQKKIPVLSPILNLFSLIQESDKLQKQAIFNMIHCRSYMSGIVGYRAKHKYGTTFLFDPRGFFADERVDGNLWNLSNPIYRLVYRYFKKKEKQFITQADHIVSLTHAGKEVICKKILPGFPPNKITVIPCCADTQLFSLASIDHGKLNTMKASLGLSNKFVLIYLGAVGTWYLTSEMMKFYAVLREKKTNTHFLFVTAENPQIIIDEAAKWQIPQSEITIVKSPRKLVPYYLAMSDAGIFFIKPSFSKQGSSPTKLGEMLSMGIPVICNAGVGDVESIISATQTGVCLKSFSETEMTDAIEIIAGMSDKSMNVEKAQKAIAFFSLEQGIKSYLGIYESLLGKP